MKKSETLLFKGWGGGNFGFWISGSWPFATIEVFEDRVSFSLFKKIEFPYHLIRYVERLGRIPIFADGVYIEIDNSGENNNLPSFITFFGFWEINKLEEILKEKSNNLLPKRSWYKNYFFQMIAFIAILVVILTLWTM